MKDFVIAMVHFFNRKSITDFGYERATNLLCLYTILIAGILILLGLKITELYSSKIFDYWINGLGKIIFMAGLLVFIFFFHFLFKKRIINLYEENLESINTQEIKYKNWWWVAFGLLPVLFVFNICLIRSLVT